MTINEMSFLQRINLAQVELKAPKNQYNDFANFKYRNAEDILEAVKPVNLKYSLHLSVDDAIVQVGDRHYIKATATLRDVMGNDEPLIVSAWAREPLSKPKMDESQTTGSASSYARKYALNGLYLIDDTKDADAMPNAQQANKPANNQQTNTYNKPHNQQQYANQNTQTNNHQNNQTTDTPMTEEQRMQEIYATINQLRKELHDLGLMDDLQAQQLIANKEGETDIRNVDPYRAMVRYKELIASLKAKKAQEKKQAELFEGNTTNVNPAMQSEDTINWGN